MHKNCFSKEKEAIQGKFKNTYRIEYDEWVKNKNRRKSVKSDPKSPKKSSKKSLKKSSENKKKYIKETAEESDDNEEWEKGLEEELEKGEEEEILMESLAVFQKRKRKIKESQTVKPRKCKKNL